MSDVLEIGVRRVDRLQVEFVERFCVSGAKKFIDGVLKENAFAVMLFDDASRRFARSESVDVVFVFVFLICLDYRAVEFISVEIDRKLSLVVVFGNKRCLHFRVLLSKCVLIMFLDPRLLCAAFFVTYGALHFARGRVDIIPS